MLGHSFLDVLYDNYERIIICGCHLDQALRENLVLKLIFRGAIYLRKTKVLLKLWAFKRNGHQDGGHLGSNHCTTKSIFQQHK